MGESQVERGLRMRHDLHHKRLREELAGLTVDLQIITSNVDAGRWVNATAGLSNLLASAGRALASTAALSENAESKDLVTPDHAQTGE